MRKAARILATLGIAAACAVIFHTEGESEIQRQNISTTAVYQVTCDVAAGSPIEKKCVNRVPVTNVAAVRPEFKDLVLGDGIILVANTPVVRDVRRGQTLRRDHFDASVRPPVPANHVLLTIRVDSSRAPGQLAAGVVVDLWRRSRYGRGGEAHQVGYALKIVSVDNRSWNILDEEHKAVTRLAFMIGRADVPNIIGDGAPLTVTVRSTAGVSKHDAEDG